MNIKTNNQITQEEKDDELSHYGMGVSAMHDSRYFDVKTVYDNEATPYNCPEHIKDILIEKLGDEWQSKFWGKNYDELFPGVKAWHETWAREAALDKNNGWKKYID